MKKFFTIILLVMMFFSAGYFGSWAYNEFSPYQISDIENWQLNFSENITNAFINYRFDIEDDFSDSGVELARLRLNKRINSILFHYRNYISIEMNKKTTLCKNERSIK